MTSETEGLRVRELWCDECRMTIFESEAVGEPCCPECGAPLKPEEPPLPQPDCIFRIVSGRPWYWRLWLVVSNPIRFVVRGHFYWQ